MSDRIFLSVPHPTGREDKLVSEALTGAWSSPIGHHVAAFEAELGQRLGVPCLATASGTAAIHLGLKLLDVGPGDEVLCSDLTFVASANPIRYLGAQPVFVDSEAESWNMDPNRLESALRKRRNRPPKALVLVHLYGQAADLDPIMDLCRTYGVRVLEDAAEALGTTYRGQPAGTFGDVGVFSFNSNKIITCLGGGALVSADPAAVERARRWANQSRLPGVAFEHAELGYNYRLNQAAAGIGRAQLAALDDRVAQRRSIAFRYRQAFIDLPGLSPMPERSYGKHTHWLSCFSVDPAAFGATAADLVRWLDSSNIEARPVWKPMHMQPLFADAPCEGGEVAEDLFHRGICLPSASSMSLEDQDRVISAVRQLARARRAA